jgi:diguanylate cyclase (GGDEF)-like protein
LQSVNGTFVNNVRVADSCLTDNDFLRIGGSIFRFLAWDNVETQYHEELLRLTGQDSLTGAYNKRSLLQYLQRELPRATVDDRPLALLLIDIDHFKRVNDEQGHTVGDFALQELTRRLRQAMRKEDVFARYGGDEFVVVLPETRQGEAVTLAERFRRLVAAHTFSYEDTHFPVTISVGVACTEGEQPLTPGRLLEQADHNLYEAKRQGRNQVVA